MTFTEFQFPLMNNYRKGLTKSGVNNIVYLYGQYNNMTILQRVKHAKFFRLRVLLLSDSEYKLVRLSFLKIDS